MSCDICFFSFAKCLSVCVRRDELLTVSVCLMKAQGFSSLMATGKVFMNRVIAGWRCI